MAMPKPKRYTLHIIRNYNDGTEEDYDAITTRETRLNTIQEIGREMDRDNISSLVCVIVRQQ